MDEDTGPSGASLALIEASKMGGSVNVCDYTPAVVITACENVQDTVGGERDSLVDVCVVEDDVGGLAPELEGYVLQVRFRCRLHNLTTN